MTDLENMALDYRVALQRYLPQRAEAALTEGYNLGRRSVVDGVSLLDLVRIHHLVLAELLDDTPAGNARDVTGAAAEFLTEVLATFDMTHRGLRPTASDTGQIT